MGLFDRFKKEKTVNETHRDRSISDVRVPAAPSPAPITPAVHVIKIYLKPFDNLDKIVRTFSVSSFHDVDLNFVDARKAYYSDPEVFFRWRFELPAPTCSENSSGFVFSCGSVRIGYIPRSSRANSNYNIFSLLSEGYIQKIDLIIRNGEYFHLNKSQYESSPDFDPEIDDPFKKGFPDWAKEKVECYVNISVSYSDYLRIKNGLS